jgi:hypothetical protein
MKKLLAVTMLALTMSVPCAASTADFAMPSSLLVQTTGLVFFNTNGTRTTRPTCATVPTRFVFDGSTPGGQALLSALQTAIARGKRVFVSGTGNCPLWSDTESVLQLSFED